MCLLNKGGKVIEVVIKVESIEEAKDIFLNYTSTRSKKYYDSSFIISLSEDKR